MKAEWTAEHCPKCTELHGLPGMVAADEHGMFCVIHECGWRRDWTPEERIMVDEHLKQQEADIDNFLFDPFSV